MYQEHYDLEFFFYIYENLDRQYGVLVYNFNRQDRRLDPEMIEL